MVISRFIAWLKRPVAWGFVLLSYIGVFAALYVSGQSVAENHKRAADICVVIDNVNENAKFRLRTEQQSLRSTRQWLYDHRYESSEETDELTKRVRENLPLVEQRVRDAQRNVEATKPPKSCKQKG